MNTPSTIREARLAALAEARKWRSDVRECSRIIRKWPIEAAIQDAEGLGTYDRLRVARECWADAIWAMNWGGFYLTRADAVAARDEAAAMRRAA